MCPGDSVIILISGLLNDATDWKIYTDSCGGNLVGSTSNSTFLTTPIITTTYYIRGEGGCVIPGNCTPITITVNDTVAPIIFCPGPQDLYLDLNCQFLLPDYSGLIITSDNCTNIPTLNQIPLPGTLVTSNSTVFFTSTDASNNSSQCSFIVNLIDTINPIDTSVTINNNILTANFNATEYQWVDCNNNFNPIPGDTLQTCILCQTVNGNYAVIVTESGCNDTS